MKKYILIAILGLFFVIPKLSNAQCMSFAKAECKPQLAPYIHDGVYNVTPIAEGETIELYKTFYSKQGYRILICADDNLPTVHFQVLDSNRNILFDNASANYVNYWDFSLTSSQMLTVSIIVGSEKEKEKKIQQGCLGVLVGFKSLD